MNSKNQKSQLVGFRILLAIPAIFALLVVLSFTNVKIAKSLLGNNLQTQQQKPAVKTTVKFTPPQITEKGEKPMMNPEKAPEYKGGMEAMQKFIASNIHYPASAMKAGTQGIVYVQFIITKTGKVSNAKVLRGIGLDCDKEALRVVKSMPDWTPGQNKGKPVSVVMQLPVKFQMQKTSPKGTVATTENPKGPYYYSDDIPQHVVEKQPEYKGGYDAMINFLKKNMKYPETAKKSRIQGTVYIQFIVEKTGKISRVKILRGISKECDEEAIRVVNSMPKWIPGRQSGKAVPVMFQIPVKFQLASK